jgi:hypothetical protein
MNAYPPPLAVPRQSSFPGVIVSSLSRHIIVLSSVAALVCGTVPVASAAYALVPPQSQPASTASPSTWLQWIAHATWRGGTWLMDGARLRLGFSTQTTNPVSPILCLYGLGATDSATALVSMPITSTLALGATIGFHHPQTAATGAAQGFATWDTTGRLYGIGLVGRLSRNVEASVRLERLTAYANSPLGTLNTSAVMVGFGVQF